MLQQRLSQGSVATQLRFGEVYNFSVIANCPQSALVKEFLEIGQYLMKIWTKVKRHLYMVHGVFVDV